jgi:type I restriction enzyme S subunit
MIRRVPLGDVADVNWGDTSVTKASYREVGYPAYSASGNDGFLPYADYNREAIILSAIGAQCGKTWYAKGKWSCIKNTMRLWSTSSDLDNRFLYWATAEQKFWPKRGAAQPFITIGDARKAEIPLPPVDEQRRIAAILDQADELRRKRRDTIARLDCFAQAVFGQMFGLDSAADRGIGREPLGGHLSFITSGGRNWARFYAPTGSRFIRSLDVEDELYWKR